MACDYRPDVIADHYDVGRDVYEVVDSETVNEAVANILQFLVAPGRCQLRMFCNDAKKRKRIEDMATVIIFNLGREEEFQRSVRIFSLSGGSHDLTSLRKRLRRIIHSTMSRR